MRQAVELQLLLASFVTAMLTGMLLPGVAAMLLPPARLTESMLRSAQAELTIKRKHAIASRNLWRAGQIIVWEAVAETLRRGDFANMREKSFRQFQRRTLCRQLAMRRAAG